MSWEEGQLELPQGLRLAYFVELGGLSKMDWAEGETGVALVYRRLGVVLGAVPVTNDGSMMKAGDGVMG